MNNEWIKPIEILKKNYDEDNTIYTKGRIFKYKLNYKTGKIFKNTNQIEYISLEVLGGLQPFINFDSTYNQTVIKYTLFDKNNKIVGTERTGVIENIYNVWLHPPRHDDLLILNTNAYPFILFDKNDWRYNLQIGFNDIETEIKSKYFKLKRNSSIKCSSKSDLGVSKARFKFNPTKGFYEMKYYNFDKSIIILTLIE